MGKTVYAKALNTDAEISDTSLLTITVKNDGISVQGVKSTAGTMPE